MSIEKKTEKRIEELINALLAIAKLDFKKKVKISNEGDIFDKLGLGINMLAEELEDKILNKEESEKRIEEISNTILAISALDYTPKANISNRSDIFDALASGLNMLGEELQSSTVSRDYLDNILKSMIDMLMVIGPDATTIKTVNQSLLNTLGYNEKELIGKPVSIIFAEEEEEDFKGTGIQELIKKGFVRNIEKNYLTKEGEKIPVLLSGSVMKNDSGKIEGVVCIARDITERKKAESELKASETKFKTLFNSAPISIIVTNSKGKIVLYNSSAQKMFGYYENEIIGNSLQILLPGKSRDIHIKQVENYFDKPGFRMMGTDIDLFARSKDGKEFPVDIALNYIQSGEGTLAMAFIQDLTDRKKMEKEKQERIKAVVLAEVEKKRSNELEKAQLANLNIMIDIDKHRKELDISLKEKEVLLREVHHRVKNNMQVIMSLIKLQSYTIKDTKLKDIFKLCQNRIKSMAFVHEDLYNSQNYKSIDFKKLTRKLTINLFDSFNINMNYIKLELDICYMELDIADAIPLALIINELVTNSLKYAFPNGKKGKVFVGYKSSGKTVKLTVSDNGIGLPDHVNFRKPKSVGLQLVKDLTYQLKGKLNYDDSEGTTFHISFGMQFSQ